jgi:hypothetical protein
VAHRRHGLVTPLPVHERRQVRTTTSSPVQASPAPSVGPLVTMEQGVRILRRLPGRARHRPHRRPRGCGGHRTVRVRHVAPGSAHIADVAFLSRSVFCQLSLERGTSDGWTCAYAAVVAAGSVGCGGPGGGGRRVGGGSRTCCRAAAWWRGWRGRRS